ncbi:MAG: TetR/AcrR family transcriptional regulator [Deltaproteobacteria bacterium]|nr:TetR/AcrR family transcriptional regulator [Deltaproteobacteria bacterium]MBW2394875.1 TetR/AcrR family transcriptional regulator [Deltaproteobacteria bacterium]
MSETIRPRSPGRPQLDPAQTSVRERLIQAAAKLVAERGYNATSIREIAANADVTPAMVAYYFGDKRGLLEAILDHAFERLVEGVQQLAAEDDATDGPFVTRFVPLYLRAVTREPWIPQFLLREVFSADTPVREQFVERFARRVAAVVPAVFAREIEAGRMRRNLDPQLTLLSLIGMCVFPLIAEPVLGPVLGFQVDAAFAERLTDHTVELFLEGAAPREETT